MTMTPLFFYELTISDSTDPNLINLINNKFISGSCKPGYTGSVDVYCDGSELDITHNCTRILCS